MARTLNRGDRNVLAWSVRRRSRVADTALTLLSGAADNGKLWYAIAFGLAATGKRRPRTAAGAGLLGIAIASSIVNGPLKFLWQRDRPSADLLGAAGTLLPLPRTYSFPSGHSASAFAFATGASVRLPAAAPVVLPLAGAVAYSRVHTGVHYPTDVVAGAALGSGAGLLGARLAQRVRDRSAHRPRGPALDAPVPHDVVLVTSEHSGAAYQLDAVRDELRRAGFQVRAEVDVRDAGRLPDLVRAGDGAPPLVIAAGGDGTVGSTANAIIDTSALLAVLPLGTSNDVARSLGIAPDPAEAVAALAGGVVCEIDAGRVEMSGEPTRTFVHAATTGLNVVFAGLATTSALRDRFGGLTYPVSAALALRRYEPFECTVQVDDGSARTFQVVHLSVSNATVFGGVLGMRVPGADLSDGLLDVIVIEELTPTRLALAVADTLVGRHAPVRRVHAMQARSVRVEAPAGGQREVAVDGEVLGSLPARFTVQPASLRVVVPAVAE